jgi:hypothetical protein
VDPVVEPAPDPDVALDPDPELDPDPDPELDPDPDPGLAPDPDAEVEPDPGVPPGPAVVPGADPCCAFPPAGFWSAAAALRGSGRTSAAMAAIAGLGRS